MTRQQVSYIYLQVKGESTMPTTYYISSYLRINKNTNMIERVNFNAWQYKQAYGYFPIGHKEEDILDRKNYNIETKRAVCLINSWNSLDNKYFQYSI